MRKIIFIFCTVSFVTFAQYEEGDRVQINYNGTWYPGFVKQVKDNKFYISYDGYSASWDTWMTADKLKKAKGKKKVLSYKVGDKVYASYHYSRISGEYFSPAVITSVNKNKKGNKVHSVKWEKGKASDKKFEINELRPFEDSGLKAEQIWGTPQAKAKWDNAVDRSEKRRKKDTATKKAKCPKQKDSTNCVMAGCKWMSWKPAGERCQ